LDPTTVSLWDLVLLEYPHGSITAPGESPVADALVRDYLAKAAMLRPVIYVRGDWFLTAVTQPPLYYDLLRTPLTAATLGEKLKAPQAPDLVAGTLRSAVLSFGRVVERRSTRDAVFWRTWDLPRGGKQELEAAARDRKGLGGLALYSLPNNLPAFFV